LRFAENPQNCVTVTINRPEIHNAFNEELIAELTQTFKTIGELFPQCRSVVLTGAGSSFSAGADLNWMKKMASYTKEQNEQDSHQLFDMFHAIRQCIVPVIARTNGSAFGGGSGLVAACDFAFALSRAKFGFTEVKLGLLPAVISPFVMEKIGAGNCSRYFLTGEKFDAVEARRIGLVQQVFETEQDMDEEITRVTREIQLAYPGAVKNCKKLIQTVASMDINDPKTKIFVASEIAKARVGKEGQAGLAAFLSKTK
jgi:methylglutaconyl-CoA hydratase